MNRRLIKLVDGLFLLQNFVFELIELWIKIIKINKKKNFDDYIFLSTFLKLIAKALKNFIR